MKLFWDTLTETFIKGQIDYRDRVHLDSEL